MDKNTRIAAIKQSGVIAIIRADEGGAVLTDTVRALANGGVTSIEITLTTPGALQSIEAAAEEFKGTSVLLGAGSVLDSETCRLAILAGAQYIVSPITSVGVIRMAHRYGMPALPGAFTANEIFTAWEEGGDLIKVFPATLGGLSYIKAVRAPMPQIPLIPTGGVDVNNLHEFLAAGVVAVGIGAALVSSDLVKKRDFAAIEARAREFMEKYRAYPAADPA
ncbi:MAG: bifunctional 4-hydroxy-2-oxoglutarate aldolase/2-dehydro-3-deoxy-phosphogluconate aldolase [Candidatus Hydrogenedentes bacterium]|nr:bifunctional 4-hydroxy-2-oxoglutarate aldolase/2-dehydro-3-deoxy-phosphogluconate aldolase [Candidatus Hydrogenedentota bacterium]